VDREEQSDIDAASAQDRRAGIPRRRLLFGAGGIVLLGAGGAACMCEAGWPVATSQAGHLRSPTSAPPPSVTTSQPIGGGSSTDTPASSGPSASGGEGPRQPQIRVVAAPQYYVDDAGPMAIALTLDDGPHPLYTPQVLAILDRYGIQATFNMVGEQVSSNLPLVREVAAAGHTITNHTWDHADMRAYPLARVVSEIDRCNDALADAGQQPSIFRAPYGYWTQTVFEACAARSLNPLGWSVDPQDWDTAHVSVQRIVRTVLRTTRPHDIILEHDGGGDRSNTVTALQIFIPELLERGFVFTAV